MLAASHALIGASLAKIVPDPGWAIPLNIFLHFAGDWLPHWDFQTRKSNRTKPQLVAISLTDAFIGYLIGWQFFSRQVPPAYLLLMMFLAQLPDWIEAPYQIFNWEGPFRWMKQVQSQIHNKLYFPWGLITQLLVVAGFILAANP